MPGHDVVAAVLIGLGVMKVHEVYQEFLPWPLDHRAKTKSTLAIAASLGLSAWVVGGPTENWLVTGLAAAGISAIAHSIDTGLRAWHSLNQLLVRQRTMPRR